MKLSLIGMVILILIGSGFTDKSTYSKSSISESPAPPRIGDYVWEDLNGDGIQGSGEYGLGGVTIELYDASNALIGSTTSSTLAPIGSYSFEDLAPGDYYLKFDASSINPNYIPTFHDTSNDPENSDITGDNGAGTTATFTLGAGENNTDIDAGFFINAQVSGYTWEDQDANGIQDGGEPDLNNVDVTIDGTTGAGAPYGPITHTTSGGGQYTFTNIPPGDYNIHFDIPGGMDAITYQDEGVDDDIDSDPDPATGDFSITLISDDVFDNIDAGFYAFAVIGDYTFEDMNADGIQGAEDNDLDGVDITLNGTTGNGTVINETTTSAGGGAYSFADVIPGTYTLTFAEPATYHYTFKDEGGNDNLDSDPDPASGDVNVGTVISAQVINNIDAGFYQFATIGDYTWEDMNGNGLQDGGDNDLSGVDITLSGTTGNGAGIAPIMVTSGGTGDYLFIDIIPGSYTLHFDVPGGADDYTLKDIGGDDDIDSDVDPGSGDTDIIPIESNEIINNVDAGFYRYVTIGDFVWEDMNGDGIQDGGEPGLAGINVTLTNVLTGVNTPTNTDGAGNYLFDATMKIGPGEYRLNFGLPGGYFFTYMDIGSDDDDSDADEGSGNTIQFPIESGENQLNWDAGMYRPGTIGDLTWRDQNVNGIQDPSEFVLPNVQVTLYRVSDGSQVDITVSDGAGFYQFAGNPDIRPDDYYIEFGLPATFAYTIQNAGAENIDSDPDDVSGLTPDFTIVSGTDTSFIDAGYYVEPPTDCPTTNTVAECDLAPVLCELEELNEFCTSMVPGFQVVPIPGCGGGFAFHNPSWFAFVAGAEDISLIIHAAPCVAGTGNIGIQWGIYDDCDLQGPITLQCNCVDPGDIDVSLTGLNIGQTYHFFIDGCSGTQCTYWIEIVEGGGLPEIFGPEDISCDSNFPDCEDICVGADVTFTLEDIFNASKYIWTVNGVESTPSENSDTTITFTTEGVYEICAYGLNDCDIADDLELCIEVTVTQLPPEDLGIFEVCQNVLEDEGYIPDNWEGGPLTSAGKDSIELQNGTNCNYWQLVEIVELPRDSVYIDTVGCDEEEIIIEGESFTYDVDDYELTIEDGAENGCDKQVFVTTKFIVFKGQVQPDCSGLGDGSVTLTFYIEDSAHVDNVIYHWYKDGFVIEDSIRQELVIYEDGEYHVEVEVSYGDKKCDFDDFAELEIIIEDFLPPTPEEFNWPLATCNNLDEYLDYEIINTDAQYEYIWSWPSDVLFGSVSSDGTILSVNWLGSAGGDICVFAFDPLCGSSDTICETILVTPGPNSLFTVTDTICLSDETIIQYTGNASTSATFEWNFSGGNNSSPLGNSHAGPHTVSWLTAGEKIITLRVNDNGCESELSTDTVTVVNPLPELFSFCNPTATTVEFEWDPVPGAESTTVEVLSGHSGIQDGLTYKVIDLTPLEEVIIVLHFETNGYCPDRSDTLYCKASDCPIISVEVTPVDTSICLDSNSEPFVLNYTIQPHDGGVVSWQGKGIVDTLTGLFNPDSAGVGDHTIRFTYLKDECPYIKKATIHVKEQPTADFNISIDTICITDNVTIDYIGNAPSGNPNWDFDGGQILSGTGLEQHVIRWNSPGLKEISLEVENNDCISVPVKANVFVHDTLDEIFISCDPATDTIAFSWTDDPQVVAYKIYINGELKDSADINKYVVYGLIPGDSVNISLVAIDSGICGDRQVSDYCVAIDCPDYVIGITPHIDTLCLDDTSTPINFVASITESDGTGTIEWNGTGIDKDSGVFDPKIAGPGTHTIFMKFKEVCSADTTFTIEVIERPVTELSVEKDRICIADSAVFHFLNTNPTTTVYDWQYDGGNLTVIDPSSFYLKWDAPGTYVVSLNTNNNVCDGGSKSIEVIVEPELIAPDILCTPTTNSIEITWNIVDCASSYNVFVNGEMVVNTTDLKYNLLDLDPNSNIDFVVEAVTECECSNVSTEINCLTEPCPDVELEIQNLPEQICISDISAASIQVSALITGPNTGVIQWSGQGIDNNGNISLSGLNPGQYIYTLDYEVSKCNYSTTDTIVITTLPNYETSFINPLCFDDENGGIIITADDNYEYYLDGVKQDGSSIQDLAAGTYTVTVKDIYGCELSETVTLVNPDPMEPSISGTAFIKENSSSKYVLDNVENFNIESIVWYYENGDTICSGPQCSSVTIQIFKDRKLCVNIINDNGCDAFACIDLTYIENVDIDIPNIFTPNDDGVNDYFYISSDNTVELVKELKIYNRWGELVFAKENFPTNDKSYGWDGFFHGKKVNPGVYVYFVVFKIKDRNDMKIAGDLTIVK